MQNTGAFPQPEDLMDKKLEGRIYLSGFDTSIISFNTIDLKGQSSQKFYAFENHEPELHGKSNINPNGGSDIASFKGTIDMGKLNVESYEPSILATACYKYYTIAGPSVCIDPDPYSTMKQKKVCEIRSTTLTGQGAPISVIQVDEDATADKTQFKITIRNAGNGDVFWPGQKGEEEPQTSNAIGKCNPSADNKNKVGRDDIGRVHLDKAIIGDLQLVCWPFAQENVRSENGGIIRLLEGEGSIFCELKKDKYKGGNTAYTTPLRIELSYFYRTSAERKVLIKKEMPSP